MGHADTSAPISIRVLDRSDLAAWCSARATAATRLRVVRAEAQVEALAEAAAAAATARAYTRSLFGST